MSAVTSPHKYHIQSNLSYTDTEGTEQSVRIRGRYDYIYVTFKTPLTG